uniref:Uncharacterized protein n=1 Tax=viral metagenome TaxID=1070528 RepID=A0A6C0KM22_9ZZZZ
MVRKYKTKSQRQRQRKTQKRRGNRKNKSRQNKKKINRTRRRYRGGTNIDWDSYFADVHIDNEDKQVLMNQERILQGKDLLNFINNINNGYIPVFGIDKPIIGWVPLNPGQKEYISNFSNSNNNNNNNNNKNNKMVINN